jgi:hypothetical protein
MTVDKVASDVAYATSGLVALTGLTLQDWFGLVGLMLAGCTFGINWYYKHRADRRAERESLHRMVQADDE